MKSALILISLLLPSITIAGGDTGFVPLVGIPGIQGGDFNSYVNALYGLAISVAALIAVVKIVLAGAKYMMDDIVTHKSEAKEDIKNSLIGLLIIIGAVIILTTVNSDLTNLSINADKVEVDNNPAPIPSIERVLEECKDDECTFFECINLQEAELSYTLPGVKGGSCDQKCESMGGIIFSREDNQGVNRQCAVTASKLHDVYTNELEAAIDSIAACDENSCILQYCDFERITTDIAIQPGDGCEDLCEADNGIFDSATAGCVLTNATTNDSNVILRINPEITYTHYAPAYEFEGENYPADPNHGLPVIFTNPLQLSENGSMVRLKTNDGTEYWGGCSTIAPNPCI
jgi:hypothetical protein